jgi:hypothetical protein
MTALQHHHHHVIVLAFTLPALATGQPQDQEFLQRFQKPEIRESEKDAPKNQD